MCPQPMCAHGLCVAGAPLKASCNPCAATVCAEDPYCCDQTLGEWDDICVSEAMVACPNCPT
jgi:hypothetical protein